MAELLSTQAILNAVFDRTTNKLNINGGAAIGGTVTGGTQGSVLFVGAASVLAQDNANFFWDDTNNFLGLGTPTPSANLDIMQAAVAGGTPQAFELVGGAHTTSIASTELTDVNWNLARTVQFATGAIPTERSMRIQGATFSFVGASTVTTAITLEVDPPVAGTNATFTNTYAARFNGSVNITTATTMLVLNNTTGSLSTILNPNSGSAVRIQGFRSAANTGGVTADVSCNTTTARTVGSTFSCLNNGSLSFEVMYYGGLLTTQRAAVTGVAQALSTVPANHTNQTLSTEISNVNFPAYTRQWATGAITTQREIFFGQPTYGFVGGSTITDAANVVIAGPPIAGTNATLTRTFSLWVQAGITRLDGALLNQVNVLPKTQAVSPYTVPTNEVNSYYTNEGATSAVTFNLPTAVAGLTFTFTVEDADGITVVASAGDTIRLSGSVSAAAGNTASTTIGSSVTLVAINATEWIGVSIVGTWVTT